MKKLILLGLLTCSSAFATKLCQHFPGAPVPCPEELRLTLQDLSTGVAAHR